MTRVSLRLALRLRAGVLASLLLAAILAPSPALAVRLADEPEDEWEESFHALAMTADGHRLFLGTRFGLFRSGDGGYTWRHLSAVATDTVVQAIAASPHDPDTVYIGTHDAGILRSTDGGLTWQPINQGLGEPDVHGLVADPTNPRIVYAATEGKGASLYRTVDGGTNWSHLGLAPSGFVGLAFVREPGAGHDHLLAATDDGLRRAGANGAWRRVPSPRAGHPVDTLAVDLGDPRRVYTTVADHVFRSADGGRTWVLVGHAPAIFSAVAVNPRRQGELYAVSHDGTVFKSTDAGATWGVREGVVRREVRVRPHVHPTAVNPLRLLAAAIAVRTAAAAQDDPECPRWRSAFGAMPARGMAIRTPAGPRSIRMKIAATAEARWAGFQCATADEIRTTVILFDFGGEILGGFHMRNVPRPLDIAFVKGSGRIFSIQRMDPSPTAVYEPLGAYRYAIEARSGFFTEHGVAPGATLVVSGSR